MVSMMLRTMVVLAMGAALLRGQSDNVKRLDEAATVLREIMDIADKAIPQRLLDKSECIVIVPGLKKGAFIVSAKYGRGFLSCRKKGGVGWIGPGAVRVEGGGIGFQIGGSETDVIMLVMNERGVQRLLSSRFTLGADASAAAGPVGRTAQADTDAMMTAEILTWSRSRGLFAGVSLQGATLRQDLDVNRELYGQPLENQAIVAEQKPAPKVAQALLGLLDKYSSRQVK
jgi:lipid-binding SYLF domain-containing protein